MGISVGLVGLGAFGGDFADLFASHPLVSRIALCDREPSRVAAFAAKEAVRRKLKATDCYGSLDAICRSDVEALVIITQHWLHAPHAVQALEAGKHVYSAVPVVTLPDGDEILAWCDRLVQTVRRSGRHYMYGETTCYRPETMYCRRRAAEGAFGDFVYAEGEYLHDVDSPYCSLRKVRESRLASAAGREYAEAARQGGRPANFGPPMHYPTHSTGGPLWVMRTHAEKVAAFPYWNRSKDAFFDGFPSNEVALFRLANGASLRISECREIGHGERETFRLYGTRGSFENGQWCDKRGETALDMKAERDALPEEVRLAFAGAVGESRVYGGHGGSHAYLVHEFVDAVANNRTPAISVWDAVRFMAAGVMANKSALRDGELLAVPDWGDGTKA